MVPAGFSYSLLTGHAGGLSSPDPSPEDALQAHCRSLEEDGAGMSPALPPAVPRVKPTQANNIGVVRLLAGTLPDPARFKHGPQPRADAFNITARPPLRPALAVRPAPVPNGSLGVPQQRHPPADHPPEAHVDDESPPRRLTPRNPRVPHASPRAAQRHPPPGKLPAATALSHPVQLVHPAPSPRLQRRALVPPAPAH